jgi:DNA-binding YbaB/EbfC family protein
MFRQPNKARGQGAAAAGGINPNMLKQAQQLQQQIQDAQEEFKTASVTTTAGGGVVTVELGGDRKLRKVSIDPDVLDPDDHEIVEDLVIAAVNEAVDKLEELQQERMSGLTGGLDLPGGLG